MSIALNAPKQNSSSSHAAKVATQRLLIAMTDHEAALFDLKRFVARFTDMEMQWFNPQKAHAGGWLETFHAATPTILLSSWSTPHLDPVLSPDDTLSLRYICHVTGSVRHVVPRSFLVNGGLVSNWGSSVAPQVAEHALLLALSLLRHSQGWTPYLRQGIAAAPTEWLKTETLFRRRVGIHGFGHVARSLISLLQPFNVDVQVYSNGVSPEWIEKHGGIPSPSLHALFERSDVIFECEALTPTTRGSVSAKVLAALPDGAAFINVGRGLVVEESALWEELKSGRLRGAMDVLSAEPIPSDTPFLALPNVLISPHIAGPTYDRFRYCGELACRNITRFIKGEPVDSVLTLEAYDRST